MLDSDVVDGILGDGDEGRGRWQGGDIGKVGTSQLKHYKHQTASSVQQT